MDIESKQRNTKKSFFSPGEATRDETRRHDQIARRSGNYRNDGILSHGTFPPLIWFIDFFPECKMQCPLFAVVNYFLPQSQFEIPRTAFPSVQFLQIFGHAFFSHLAVSLCTLQQSNIEVIFSKM